MLAIAGLSPVLSILVVAAGAYLAWQILKLLLGGADGDWSDGGD